MNRVSIKNVQHSERQSQETNCFVAAVYIDGVKAGQVENDGHGGPDRFTPWELEKKVTEIAKTMPKYKDEEFEVGSQLISDLLSVVVVTKTYQRLMRNRAFFIRADGKLGETRPLTAAQQAGIKANPQRALDQLKGQRFVTDIDEIVKMALAA